jgi:hypothetical protein
MFRLVVLLLFSCNVIASQEDVVVEQNVQEVRSEILEVNNALEVLNKKVDISINENGKLIEDNRQLLRVLNVSINSQNNNQKKFVEILNELKKVKEKTTDLEFKIATDVPYVITVALSILASVFITWLLLRRDSNSSHNRLVKEFRQKWVNDFRDTTSSYVDIVSQIETFQQNNIDYYLTRHSLIELRKEFDEKIVKIEKKDLEIHHAAGAKLNAKRGLEKFTKDEKTDHYQLKNSEYLKLLSGAKILESKLMLLLKPEFSEEDALDEAVFDAMTELKDYVHSPQGRHGIISNGSLAILSEKLLKTTQLLLKTEWDRIKDPKSK